MNYPLGRHVNHDPRSLNFPVRHDNQPLQSVYWSISAPVLDQGQLGSCTGNALAQWINTDFARSARTGRGYLVEKDAVDLYSAATKLDNVPGQYPPTDTGSDGVSVAKAGVNAGYLASYQHAFGFDHFAQAVMLGPVIVGTDWLEDMFNPDPDGLVHATGAVAGGHEYLVLGLDVPNRQVLCLNSWGTSWGVNGHFKIGFDDFTSLLNSQGDVTAPTAKVYAPPPPAPPKPPQPQPKPWWWWLFQWLGMGTDRPSQ